MQPYKHKYIVRERETDQLIAQYCKRPPKEMRNVLENTLKAERSKFKQLQQYKEQSSLMKKDIEI